jgi:hypothetical protein
MEKTKQLMEAWRPKTKKRVQRNDESYRQCYETTVFELERLLDIYKNTVFEEDMRARLYRDNMDHWIRRYHDYAIRGNIKSHYRQRNVSMANEDSIFEHTIPEGVLRDMLIDEVITINQALNAPTCRISRTHDKMLRERSLHDNNPEPWFPFKRYVNGMVETVNGQSVVPEFETYNGQLITNLNTWSFGDHCSFFGIN